MNPAISILVRLSIALLIIGGGVKAMKELIRTKTLPAQIELPEQRLRVDLISATFNDTPVRIEGYGQVRSRDTVSIAPEVPGRVIALHAKLDAGEIIPANEVLFEVDPRDYQARVDQSIASINQLSNSITRLEKQLTVDTQRLETFKRSRDLAKAEFERVKSLYEKDKVGSQSQVDGSELAYNRTNDAFDQLELSLELSPIRIQEANHALDAARAMAQLATTNLERCQIRVPFNARIKNVILEKGQYVSPGQPVLSLADDSILEIAVPIDSKQARTWLAFDATQTPAAWFTNLKQVPVQVEWTEDQHGAVWNGQLTRVEKFDPSTRTLTLVAQIHSKDAVSPLRGSLPLVEGMFCKVVIPGKTARHVVQIPVECVSFGKDSEGYRSVHLSKEDPEHPGEFRLDTRKVLESHIDGNSIFIQEGLNEGDQVVVTRLMNPLNNSLLETNLIETLDVNE